MAPRGRLPPSLQRAASSRAAAANPIRGPQSALTDFLASHNISANQIRLDADARRAAADASRQAAGLDTPDSEPQESNTETPPTETPSLRRNESKAQEKKRKKEDEKAVAKIKANKKFQRDHMGMDDDELDAAAWEQYRAVPAKLGQIENCKICDKRFPVTGYSRAGPGGGLLCPACTKEMDGEQEGPAKKKRKTAVPKLNRRETESRKLDGTYHHGAKSLQTLCIDTLVANVEFAESLGDLPDRQVEKAAQLLSKRRKITPETWNLFLRPESDTIVCYEGAKLGADDYIKMFQIVPHVKHIRLRNAIQFKNVVMDYLIGCPTILETFSIFGANLIDDERWNGYLTHKGSALRTLKVYWTDGHFGDEQLEQISISCPNLTRLKIAHNQKVTDEGLFHLAKLTNLRHLTLEIYTPTSAEPYVEILNSIGQNLETFSLTKVAWTDDSVLESIHNNCKDLRKLRITENEVLTDAAFVSLFTDWANPGLSYVDFNKCRHVDATVPKDNPDNIGLCSSGFEALMSHSGRTLTHLNIHGCRHISTAALEGVFSTPGATYPLLTEIDVSFVWGVNDFVVGSIFRACPKLKTLKVFGDFEVKDVRVPRGRILIGVPNAVGMQIEGEDDYLTPPPEAEELIPEIC